MLSGALMICERDFFLRIICSFFVVLVSAQSSFHFHYSFARQEGFYSQSLDHGSHSEDTCQLCLHRSLTSSTLISKAVLLFELPAKLAEAVFAPDRSFFKQELHVLNFAPPRAPPSNLL